MAVEVTPAVLIPGEGGDLPQIVQEGRPAKAQLRRNTLHYMGDVGEQVIGVMGRVLIEAEGGFQLRDHRTQHRGEPKKVFGGHQGEEFT